MYYVTLANNKQHTRQRLRMCHEHDSDMLYELSVIKYLYLTYLSMALKWHNEVIFIVYIMVTGKDILRDNPRRL